VAGASHSNDAGGRSEHRAPVGHCATAASHAVPSNVGATDADIAFCTAQKWAVCLANTSVAARHTERVPQPTRPQRRV